MSVAHLPLPGWPLMLSDEMAAAFLSVPVAAFLRAVAQGSLPAPRLVAGKRRWSRIDLERVLHADIMPQPLRPASLSSCPGPLSGRLP